MGKGASEAPFLFGHVPTTGTVIPGLDSGTYAMVREVRVLGSHRVGPRVKPADDD